MATAVSVVLFCLQLIFVSVNAHGEYGQNIVTASVGAPWPMPQNIKQSSTVYPVNVETFMFQATGMSCDILTEAFKRYRTLTFGSAAANQELRFHPGFTSAAGVITAVNVGVSTACEGEYPKLGSDESYTLTINQSGATLQAKEVWGALRGLETFSQLVVQQDTGEFSVMDTMISDAPRFAHRGLLLDTSRHFLSVGAIMRNLEAMSQNKFNVFHWHIVDDPAFPYQSTKFPGMSEKGAYSPATHVYTQSDIRAIIEHARLLGIRVMPEFDSPGHTQSWGKAINGLLTPCYKGGKPEGSFGPIDPSNENTFTFLKEFFDELATVFPDHYLHMGGDEVSFNCWHSNPNITKFMEMQNFTTYPQLEQYYIQRLLDIISEISKGYQIWQEVIDKGVKVRPDTVVEVWKGSWKKEIAKVTQLGYKTLLSTCWYLDYISYGSDWITYYNCEPYDFTGSDQQKALIMGGETTMWGEYVDDTNVLSRLWPRAASVGERLWSAQSVNSTSAAQPRLLEHRCRMVRRGFPAEPITGPGHCDVEYKAWQPK